MFDAPRWDNDPNSPRRRSVEGRRHAEQSLRWFGRQLQRQFDRVDAAQFKDIKELGIVSALIDHIASSFNTAQRMLDEMTEGGGEG